MTNDMPPSAAQSVRTNRSSYSSSYGNGDTPLHHYATVINGDGYESDSSNFAPPRGSLTETLTPNSLSMDFPAELALPLTLIDRFQVEEFLDLMQKQTQSCGKSGNVVCDKLTIEDMLCFQKDPIPTSLLKLHNYDGNQATTLFQIILKYMGVDSSDCRLTPISLDKRIKLVEEIFEQRLVHPEIQDELFVQILKQTRGNPDRESLVKAWEIMYVCASFMFPCKDIREYLSEYADQVAHGATIDAAIRALAFNTLRALERSAKAGPRHIIPSFQDIEALLTKRKFTTKVFFLDKTFKEITYDMSTTVADAVEELAGILKLTTYSSFGLFERRIVATSSESLKDSWNEEYVGIDDNKHIKDILTEFEVAEYQSEKEISPCKLIFKKKVFRESDEAVTDPMLIQLSYIQLQHDYILGCYPVGIYDAVDLSALQMVADIGHVMRPVSRTDWDSFLERFLPREIAKFGERWEWELDILNIYHSLEYLTKDEARRKFLHTLRKLPYGNSVFFNVGDIIDDPIRLLPSGRIILGINNRGVHFFSADPMCYMHSADLRDITEFGKSRTAVYFVMRVADDLSLFQFETEQGEEICAALRTHVNDAMLCCNSNEQSATTAGSLNEDVSSNLSPPGLELYDRHVEDSSKVVEEPQRNIDQLLEELHKKQKQEDKILQELEGLKELLIKSDKLRLEEVTNERDMLRTLCDEKDKALEATELEKRDMEARMIENGQVLQKLEGELKFCKDVLFRRAKETIGRLVNEKLIAGQKVSQSEKKNSQEIQVKEINTTVIEVDVASMCSLFGEETPIKYIKDVRIHNAEALGGF